MHSSQSASQDSIYKDCLGETTNVQPWNGNAVIHISELPLCHFNVNLVNFWGPKCQKHVCASEDCQLHPGKGGNYSGLQITSRCKGINLGADLTCTIFVGRKGGECECGECECGIEILARILRGFIKDHKFYDLLAIF